jgi:hypothetical protein
MRVRRDEDAGSDDARVAVCALYRIGAAAAIFVIVVALLEMVITFLPGGSAAPASVIAWFTLLQDNWFMGVRNLGLLNIFINIFGIPTYMALYAAHRRRADAWYAAIAAIVFFTGVAVFLATNTAFPLLRLSSQYAGATTAVDKAAIEAAGTALLSIGQSHTAGTFLAFLLSEAAGLMISVVMLRSGIFGRATAIVGMVGFSLLLLFETVASFVPALFGEFLFVAGLGGLLSMIWYGLTARRLLDLSTS